MRVGYLACLVCGRDEGVGKAARSPWGEAVVPECNRLGSQLWLEEGGPSAGEEIVHAAGHV